MNIKPFLEKFLHNWKAKLACIVIAVIVYFFHQFSSYSKKTIVIPLDVVEEGVMTPLEPLHVKNVRVTVRGKSEDIQRISDENFHAYADISSATKKGLSKFPVLVDANKDVLSLETIEISTKPEYVEINLDEKYERYVLIEPLVKGDVAQNFEYEIESVNPSTVKMTGPKSLLQKMRSVYTEAVDVDRKSSSFETKVPLENKNSLIKFISDKEMSVLVNVKIYENKKTKTFAAIKNSYKNVSQDFVAKASNEYFDINLEGAVSAIDALRNKDIQLYVDLTEIGEEGEYSLPLICNVPTGISVLSISPSEVTVTVSKVPPQEENTVLNTEPPLTEKNQNENSVQSKDKSEFEMPSSVVKNSEASGVEKSNENEKQKNLTESSSAREEKVESGEVPER